jgi:hypothetical protein
MIRVCCKSIFDSKAILTVAALITIVCNISWGQTFTNNTIAAQSSWNASLTRMISVSGLSQPLDPSSIVLKQVNIHMGRQADGTRNFSRYTITLTSPAGTAITIVSGNPNPISFPNSSVREFNTKFRDNQHLRTPAATGGAGASFGEPWHIGYYRVLAANSFSNFNGENPNGTWTLTITENSTADGARFNFVDLIFGSAFEITDYTSSPLDNDNCLTPYCLRSSEIVIGTNDGFTAQASDMFNSNTIGCEWNAAQNNSAWFKFEAITTGAHATFSGISGNLQILGIYSSLTDPCSPATNTVVNGGCPTGLPNDTYISPRYTNGSSYNNQLIMSGLTPGQTYYLIVDGTGGAISPFYIEIEGAAETCSDILPVTLSSFSTTCNDQYTSLHWETASEQNNDYFTVERSMDGTDWRTLALVTGNGNTNSTSFYEWTDPDHLYGIRYYRLSQTDYDGQFEVLKVISSDCGIDTDGVSVLPNPNNGEFTVTGIEEGSVIQIINLTGQVVYEEITTSNFTVIQLNTHNKGIYFLRSQTDQVQTVTKFIIK